MRASSQILRAISMDDKDFLNLVDWIASLPVSSFAFARQGDNNRRGDNTVTRLQAVENAKIREAARHRNALSRARGEGRAEIQAKLDNALREATRLRAALNATRAHLNGNPFVSEANAIWDRIMQAIQRQPMPQAERDRLVAAVTRAKDRVLDMTLAIALYLRNQGMQNGEIAALGLRLLHESDRATAEHGRANRLQVQLDAAREDVRLREATIAQLQADAQALEQNIAELRGEAQARGGELDAANQRHAEAQARVADAERRLAESRAGHAGQVAGLLGTIAALQGQIARETAALEGERNALAAARAALAARDAQVRQQSAELERLRGGPEPGSAAVQEQLAQSLRAARAAAEEVRRLEERVSRHQEENAALVRALDERTRDLAQGASTHASRVSALEAEITSLQEEVRNLQAERLRGQGVTAAALAVATSKEAELRGKNELIHRMEEEMAEGRDKIEALERRVSESNARIQELQENLEVAQRRTEALRQNVETAEENLRSKEGELVQRMRELDEARGDASLCKEETAALKEQIRVLKESEVRHKNEIEVLSSDIRYHNRKLADLEEQKRKAADEIQTLSASLQKTTADRDAANEANTRLSDHIDTLRREMNDTSTAIAALRHQLDQTQQELDNARLQKASDDAYVDALDSSITAHEATISSLNTQLEDLRTKQAEDGREMERLESRIQELEGGNLIQTLEQEVKDLKRNLNEWELELERVSGFSSGLSSELGDKQRELDEKQQALVAESARIESLSKRLEECNEKVNRLERERQQTLDIHQVEVQTLNDTLHQLREQLAEAERAQSSLNRGTASSSSLAANLSESLQNADAIRSRLDGIRDLVKASANARSRLSDFKRNSEEGAGDDAPSNQSMVRTVEETDKQLSEAITALVNAQESIRHQQVDIVRSMTKRVVSILGSMASLVNALPSADVSKEALRVSRVARKRAESDLETCQEERQRLLTELQAYRDNPSRSIGLFATAWEHTESWDPALRVLDQATVSDILTRANNDWKRVYNIALNHNVINPYTVVNTYLHMSLECTRNIVTERGRREARKIFHERFREHFQRLNMVTSSHWSHVLHYIRTDNERETKAKHELIVRGNETFDHIQEEDTVLLVAMKYTDFIRFQFCAEIMDAHSGSSQIPIHGHAKSTDAARSFFCTERQYWGSKLKAQHQNGEGRRSSRSQTASQYIRALVDRGWKLKTPWHTEEGQKQFYDRQRDVLDLFLSPPGTPEDEEYKELKARFLRQSSGEGSSGA